MQVYAISRGLARHAADWFHGTSHEPFSRFDFDRENENQEDTGEPRYWNAHLGAHFTTLHHVADEIAEKHGSGHVMHIGLNVKNPKHYPLETHLDEHAEDWAKANGYKLDRETYRTSDALRHHPQAKEIAHGFRQHLKDQKYDGITYGNIYEGPHGHECAIAFHPDQIHIQKTHSPDDFCPESAGIEHAATLTGLFAEAAAEDFAKRDGEQSHDWDSRVRRGLSLGDLSHDEARAHRYTGGGHESNGWKPLPSTLYHTTTDLAGVMAHGLKAAHELGHQNGHGLGGTPNYLSMTDREDHAHHMLDALHEYHSALTGKLSLRDMKDKAERGEGAEKPFHKSFMSTFGSNPHHAEATLDEKVIEPGFQHYEEAAKKGWEPHPEFHQDFGEAKDGRKIGTGWIRPMTDDEKLYKRHEMYGNFSRARDWTGGGKPSVLFISNDRKGFAAKDPSNFGVLKLKPKPGAQGHYLPGEHEWRTGTGDAVEIDGKPVRKTGAAITPSFEAEEKESGSEKWPTEVRLHAMHPETGDRMGTLKYWVPRRKSDKINIRGLDTQPDHRRQGVGSALMDEMQRRHPGTPINHGERTDDGKGWWKGYTKDKKVTKGRTIATLTDLFRAPRKTAGPAEESQHFPQPMGRPDEDSYTHADGVHRGMNVVLPPHIHKFVHDSDQPAPAKAHLLLSEVKKQVAQNQGPEGEEGSTGGLGNYWAPSPHKAAEYASQTGFQTYKEHEREHNCGDPDRGNGGCPTTHVVVHADTPPEEHHWDENFRPGEKYDPEISWRLPVRPDAPLNIRGVSWREGNDHWDSSRRYSDEGMKFHQDKPFTRYDFAAPVKKRARAEDEFVCMTRGDLSSPDAETRRTGALDPWTTNVYAAQKRMTESGNDLQRYGTVEDAGQAAQQVLQDHGFPRSGELKVHESYHPDHSWVVREDDLAEPDEQLRLHLGSNHFHNHAVLHEMAHLLAGRGGHGPHFVKAFRGLLKDGGHHGALGTFDEHFEAPEEAQKRATLSDLFVEAAGSEVCPNCNRAGEDAQGRECDLCDGQGYVSTPGEHKPWMPSGRYWGPNSEQNDQRLFDGSKLRPEVRQEVLGRVGDWFEHNGYQDWREWLRVYFAGSQAAKWLDKDGKGNGDFDVLLGIHWPVFREAHPEAAGKNDLQVTTAMTDGLWHHANVDNLYVTLADGQRVGPFNQTYFCNPVAWDIKKLHPYAAYDVTADKWAVEPLKVADDWGPDKLPKSYWGYADSLVKEIEAIGGLPPEERARMASNLWEEIHTHRSDAFSDGGKGLFDISNIIEKYLDQAPGKPWDKLREWKREAPVKTLTSLFQEGASRKVKKANGADSNGVMIALVPPEKICKALAVEGGEPVDNLHVTLAYLGGKDDHEDDHLASLPDLVESWARTREPLKANVGGVGTFVNPNEHVLWAAVDIPGGTTFRDDLVRYLEGHGYSIKNDHGWTPHITLAYGNSHFRFMPKVKPESWTAAQVWVCVGGHWQPFPMKG